MEKPTTSRSDPDSRRAYSRWHYQQNKEAYKKRARLHDTAMKKRVREYCRDYAADMGCVDCGEKDPVVLEFDHRPDSNKLFNVGEACKLSLSINTVMREIEKCDVRCANCHRRITYQRAGLTHRTITS